LKRPETSLSKTSNSHSNGPKKPASSPPRSHSQTIPKKDVKSQSQSSLPEKKKISKDDEYDPLSSKAKTSISLQSKTQKPAKKPDEYDPLSYSADKKKVVMPSSNNINKPKSVSNTSGSTIKNAVDSKSKTPTSNTQMKPSANSANAISKVAPSNTKVPVNTPKSSSNALTSKSVSSTQVSQKKPVNGITISKPVNNNSSNIKPSSNTSQKPSSISLQKPSSNTLQKPSSISAKPSSVSAKPSSVSAKPGTNTKSSSNSISAGLKDKQLLTKRPNPVQMDPATQKKMKLESWKNVFGDSKHEKPKAKKAYYSSDEEDEGNLEGFVVSDEDEEGLTDPMLEEELNRLRKIRNRRAHLDDQDEPMEAGFDQIELEDRRATEIAELEDEAELENIKEEEEREKRRKKKHRKIMDD